MMARALRQNPPIPTSFLIDSAGRAIGGPVLKSQEAFCIGCGCTDGHACTHTVTGPCWWIKVDRDLGIGVCSECEEKVELFETMALVMHEKVTLPGADTGEK